MQQALSEQLETPVLDESRLNRMAEAAAKEAEDPIRAGQFALGDTLGFYLTLAECGALPAAELALHTGTAESFVRQWLDGQVLAGYIEHDATSDRFYLTAEQAYLFGDLGAASVIILCGARGA